MKSNRRYYFHLYTIKELPRRYIEIFQINSTYLKIAKGIFLGEFLITLWMYNGWKVKVHGWTPFMIMMAMMLVVILAILLIVMLAMILTPITIRNHVFSKCSFWLRGCRLWLKTWGMKNTWFFWLVLLTKVTILTKC